MAFFSYKQALFGAAEWRAQIRPNEPNGEGIFSRMKNKSFILADLQIVHKMP